MRTILTTLLYIFNCFIFLDISAQKTGDFTKNVEFGMDVSKYASLLFNRNRVENEFYSRVFISEKVGLGIEIGNSVSTLQKNNYDYHVNGYYLKTGTDYMLVQNKSDVVFIGFRYGYSNFRRAFQNIIIPGIDKGYNTSTEPYKINAHWLEGLIGMNVSVFKNIFLGWTIRGKLYVTNNQDPVSNPLYVPGFGKKTRKLGAGFTYYAIYRFGN